MIAGRISIKKSRFLQPSPVAIRVRSEGVAVFAFWSFLAVLYATQYYVESFSYGHGLSWWRLFAQQLMAWWLCALLTFLIFWLNHRFPLDLRNWKRGLSIHFPVSLVFALIHPAHFTLLNRMIHAYPVRGETFLENYLFNIKKYFAAELFIYAAVLCAVQAYEYYRKFREREMRASDLETQLAKAEVQALKMQLQPHFLFNTLHSITGLIRANRSEAAIEMVVGLSELLRLTLESSGKQEVPLRQELEFLRKYIDIQRERYGARLEAQIFAPPDVLDALVPNLLLQPIVENALRHGISKIASGGLVMVQIQRTDDHLRLEFYNDGPGLPADWQDRKSRSVGILNTEARLRQLYGDLSSFDISNYGDGVQVVVTIPYHKSYVFDRQS